MSRIPQAPSRGVPPRTGAIPRPSNTGMQSGATSSRTCPGPQTGTSKPPPKKKKEPQFLLPALSTLRKVEEEETALDKLKKKTIRRNAPEGEDAKMLREILKGLKDQEVTVHEFVGLVAPYTGDNGTLLRTVLAAELSYFRSMARKIYDNMTQDISDVLTNEHIQLTEMSREKDATYSEKMMRAIDEIYESCPNFSFDKYYTDPEYLSTVFPRAVEAVMDEDREQLLLRQEAYHRMMWLRSEGERLAEENKKLQARMKELKKRQKEEMRKAAEMDKHNDEKRVELEETQEVLQDKLDDMNASIEQAIVEQEINLQEQALDKIPPPPQPRQPQLPPRSRTRPAENWNVRAAVEIEEAATTEALVAESSRVSIASSKSSTGAVPKISKPKKKKKPKRQPQMPQDPDAFHYSPPRTPPQAQQQQRPTSPFHYSPPRTPQAQSQDMQQGQELYDQAQAMETTRVTTTTRTVEQDTRPQPHIRRSLAPRDTWTGF